MNIFRNCTKAAICLATVLSVLPSREALSQIEETTNWSAAWVQIPAVPDSGTFWSWQLSSNFPPSPVDPWPGLPLYQLQLEGSTDVFTEYLYDDRTVVYSNFSLEVGHKPIRTRANGAPGAKEVPAPGDGGGGGPADTWDGVTNHPIYAVNSATNYALYTSFWLSISNDPTYSYVTIESTLSNVTYEILTNDDLTLADGWGVWETLLATNNVTPAPPLVAGTNQMFFKAVLVWSTCATYSPALPDWWTMEYFGSTTCVNPSANPTGDGIDNWDKFLLGLNPNVSYVSPLIVSPPGGNYIVTPTIRVFSLAGSSIKYTTDGSLPSSTHGTSISSGVALTSLPAGNFTLKAWESGSYTNVPVVNVYTIIPATPVLSLASGVYASNTTLQISCATTNAVVRYTTNGTTPTTSSPQIYATNVIALTTNETIMATAWLSTTVSPVAVGNYIVAGPPSNDNIANAIVLTGSAGEFRGTTIASTLEPFEMNDFDFYFYDQTYDGNSVWYQWTAPSTGNVFIDTSRLRYSTFFIPYVPTNSGTVPTNLVQATFTYNSDGTSLTLSATNGLTYYFTISDETSEGAFDVLWQYTGASQTPIFTPDAGTNLTPVLITVSDNDPNAVIHYTLDGSTPTTSSAIIASGSALLITNTTTLKAAAWRVGLSGSAVKTALYTINASAPYPTLTASAPLISPTNQTFSTSLTVTLTCTNAGSVVYYTLDGSQPSLASSSVTSGGMITITSSAIVNAVGWVTNMNLSPAATAQYAKAGSYTVNDGIPDSGKLAIGANILIADAGNVNPNPFAHGLDNMQVYQNQSVLLADNYSTLSDGIPDWWMVKFGYSTSTTATTLGANGQTLLTSYLAGLTPTNPNSQPGQLPPIDFHMVHGPTNSMVMVLDNVSSNIASYFLTCIPTDVAGNPTGAAVLAQIDADTAIPVSGQSWSRFFLITNQLTPGYWVFTMQGVSSSALWSTTSSNTFTTANEGYDYFGGTEYNYWARNVGIPIPVVGYTNVNPEKELVLAQILRAESDVFMPNTIFEDQSGGAQSSGAVIYNNRVPLTVTAEPSWGTLTFQFDTFGFSYGPTGFASYFTPICATPDLGMDCGTVYTNYPGYYFPPTGLTPLQVDYDGVNPTFEMPDDTWGPSYRFNPAGLEYSNVTYRIGTGIALTLTPGESNEVPYSDFSFEASLSVETPTFQTVAYYFDGRDYPVANNSSAQFNQSCPPLLGGSIGLDGWIGPVAVSVTNPIIVAQVGKPVHLQSWSGVIAVRPNGTPITNQVYGIQEDFAQAYFCDPATGDVPRTTQTNYNGKFKIDTNNAVQTGILSPGLSYPYNTSLPFESQGTRSADFTPTQVGKVIVTTVPDPNGYYGEVTIYVIDIEVDKTHDGVIDNRDLTSINNPMQFWVNNDVDRWHSIDLGTDSEQDDMLINDSSQAQWQQVPDCQYRDAINGNAIPSTRDLEDYARLWVPGLSNLMQSLPTNYTVTLQWRNNNGAGVRLFEAAEEDGGTNYLFSGTAASNQVNETTYPCLGYVSPTETISLSSYFASYPYGSSAPGEHYIFCGTSSGNDELVCQIRNPWGAIAGEASVFLNLKDIKQMYERWTVGDDPSTAPTGISIPAYDGLPSGVGSFQYSSDSTSDINTPYILHVHGSNMELWDKDRYAETMYKRLYWQGYHGRFGSFRWPTASGFIVGIDDPAKFFGGIEYAAWQSALGLKNLLTRLNILYPGQVQVSAHSMGNIVVGEALRQATNTLVQTYTAFQGNTPAHTYDTNAPTLTVSPDAGEPNVYAHYWNATNAQYFAGAIGAANYVNFFNTNDFVLNAWLGYQPNKPVSALGYGYISGQYYEGIGSSPTIMTFPTDTYPIFAFCQQAKCNCIGEQANLGGQFTFLGNPKQVDLFAAPYSFGIAHKGHSAEFRSDNMSRAIFWDQVLVQMGLK